MASTVPVAGSAYTYAYATMGEFVAWVIGWDLISNMPSARQPSQSGGPAMSQAFCAILVWSFLRNSRLAPLTYDSVAELCC